MKMKEMVIHNFKSIAKDCYLVFDKNITAVVGASESGKTNILEALNKFFVKKPFDKSDICTFAEGSIENDSYMVSITFIIEETDDKEAISQVDERLINADEFTIRKCKNGKYVLEESGLGERRPKEPQAPEQLIEIHNTIRQNLENANNVLVGLYETLPEDSSERQNISQSMNELVEYMPLSGFDPKTTETEERAFLAKAVALVDDLLKNIQDSGDAFAEVSNVITTTRAKLDEAIPLSYETIQEIDINRLLELCPQTIYMKDSDIELIPDSVAISGLEADDKKASIYKPLLNIAKITVADIKEIDPTVRDRNLLSGKRNINNFLKLWSQEKLDATFSVDKDNILFHIRGKEGHYGKLSDRSEGFRWFLSFCINYQLPKDSSRKTMLLLDEPGLHLHASAQKDLLEQFAGVAKENQIVYTTHSPFMINKNYPERIRAALKGEEPKGTDIDNKPYRATKGGCYEPIRTSIGITLGNSLFIGGCNLIVEGFVDQVLLTAFSRYLAKQGKKEFINLQDVCITPAGGVDNVPYFAYLCNLEDMNPVILLDNDTGGNNAYSRIEKEKVIDVDRVIRVRDAVPKKGENILEIEDLIDHKYYHDAVQKAYKELTGITFSNNLPETYEGVLQKQQTKQRTSNKSPNVDTAEQQASTEANREKRVGERSSQPRGTTKVYSEFFESKKWGGFDKALVARTVSSKLDDGESPEDSTLSNFEKLYKKINGKIIQNKM